VAPSGELDDLIEEMFETLRESEGLGLAAPQVGISKRLAVIHFGLISEGGERIAMLNPSIIEKGEEQTRNEGCLSFPGLRLDVNRASWVIFEFLDPQGNRHRYRAHGLAARAVQHEIDHLNGILFIDYLPEAESKSVLEEWEKLQHKRKA